MFVRVIRSPDPEKGTRAKEMLVNVNTVWKIEVEYGVKSQDAGSLWKTSVEAGFRNPEAIRVYRIFFGSEEILLPADPDDPVVKVLATIYQDAIKSNPPPKEEDEWPDEEEKE